VGIDEARQDGEPAQVQRQGAVRDRLARPERGDDVAITNEEPAIAKHLAGRDIEERIGLDDNVIGHRPTVAALGPRLRCVSLADGRGQAVVGRRASSAATVATSSATEKGFGSSVISDGSTPSRRNVSVAQPDM
jgi:hypothetical protein